MSDADTSALEISLILRLSSRPLDFLGCHVLQQGDTTISFSAVSVAFFERSEGVIPKDQSRADGRRRHAAMLQHLAAASITDMTATLRLLLPPHVRSRPVTAYRYFTVRTASLKVVTAAA